jgi:hypothetical protein
MNRLRLSERPLTFFNRDPPDGALGQAEIAAVGGQRQEAASPRVADVLAAWLDDRGYHGTDWVPHDAKVREAGAPGARTRIESMIDRPSRRPRPLRSDSGYLTYIITTRRMTSGELLKYRNGLVIE